MQYKTIPLRLLEDRPKIYEQLHRNRQLLPTIERLAKELKARHEAWKDQIAQARPDSDPNQIRSEAMEMAIQEPAERLPSASPPSEGELSLDSAMAHLLAPTPPAEGRLAVSPCSISPSLSRPMPQSRPRRAPSRTAR